jgi:hypothetical protein
MRFAKPLALGFAVAAIAAVTCVPKVRTRGVRLLAPSQPALPANFAVEQSAALFVGVREFRNDRSLRLDYAVDDAVDLAWAFAFDPRLHLVDASRVTLALSGPPQKPESQRKFDELRHAGARFATADDLLRVAREQAALAGKDGLLIMSFATHGFVEDGVPYILGALSTLRERSSAISAAKLFEVAGESKALRSLVFVDACRDRRTDSRGPRPDSEASRIRRIGLVRGQAVLYAAGTTYERRGNGIFTRAVLDGLNCKAGKSRGLVTVETLRAFVERDVRKWIQIHRDPSIRVATEVVLQGDTDNLPLTRCWEPPPPGFVPGGPVRTAVSGNVVTAVGEGGAELWHRDLGARIVGAEVADLDGWGARGIVAGVEHGVVVLDRDGRTRWTVSERLPLRQLLTADLHRKHRDQVLALFGDRLTIFGRDGSVEKTVTEPGLQQFAVDRPTSSFAWRIILAAPGRITLLDHQSKRKWSVPVPGGVASVQVIDQDNDAVRDIVVTTLRGEKRVLDFKSGR